MKRGEPAIEFSPFRILELPGQRGFLQPDFEAETFLLFGRNNMKS